MFFVCSFCYLIGVRKTLSTFRGPKPRINKEEIPCTSFGEVDDVFGKQKRNGVKTENR